MGEDLTKKLPISDRDAILTAIKNMDDRLQRLEQRVEERLHDTRPIWHKVVDDISQLQAGVERLETGVERLEKGQGELRGHILDLSRAVRDVSRDQIVINDVVRKIQLDFHTIDERLHRLEVNRN
jgi:hypothetical protein